MQPYEARQPNCFNEAKAKAIRSIESKAVSAGIRSADTTYLYIFMPFGIASAIELIVIVFSLTLPSLIFYTIVSEVIDYQCIAVLETA